MNNVVQLWGYANQLVDTIGKWVEAHDKKRIPLNYSKLDQLHLMTLRTWALRYRLPVYEILDLVVPVLRDAIKGQVGHRRRARRPLVGLGVSVTTLTGLAAERILLDQIGKKFPDAQHIGIWRYEERYRQIQREQLSDADDIPTRQAPTATLLGSSSTSAFIQIYSRRIQAERSKEAGEMASKSRKRKAYRWNPWR